MTSYPTGLSGPATHVFDVAPNNDDPLPITPKAIRAAGAGTITFKARDSENDVAHPVADGEVIFAIITHVRATGTDVDVIGYA